MDISCQLHPEFSSFSPCCHLSSPTIAGLPSLAFFFFKFILSFLAKVKIFFFKCGPSFKIFIEFVTLLFLCFVFWEAVRCVGSELPD